jgi:MFS family permease
MESIDQSLHLTVVNRKWLVFGLSMASYTLCGTASTLMPVYLPVVIPEIMNDNVHPGKISEERLGEIGAYINAIFLYGWMVGGLIFGLISDRIGRVKTLALATVLFGLGTFLMVLVFDYLSLICLRFFTGMGVGGVLLVSTVFISEIWEERTRPVMLGILAVSFPIGIVASGSLNILFSDWRQAFMLGIVPITIGIAVLLFAPESYRWKMTRTIPAPNPPRIFDIANRRNLFAGALIFGSVLIGLWGVFSWLPTWVQTLLKAGSDGQTERGFTMILLGIGGIVGGVISGFLIKKIGQRRTLMGTFFGCIVLCAVLFLTNKLFSPVIYLEMGLLALCFGISQGALSSYIPELFPIAIRATATGFCFNVGRFFTATAVFFIGSLVAMLGGFGNALLVFSTSFLVALLITWTSKRDDQKKS